MVLVSNPERLLLLRRAERAGDPWSGQMGLPGGRRHPDDADLLATAIRETYEEVGLSLSRARLLGRLDDLAPLTPVPVPVTVRPYVFALNEPPDLTPNQEVSLTLWVEIALLKRPGIYRPATLAVRGQSRTLPAYHIGEHLVWGLTERILTPLLAITLP